MNITQAHAVATFLVIWNRDLATDLATQLSCGEVKALAALMRAHEHPAAAADWILSHSYGDEEGDEHERTPNTALMLEMDALTATYPGLMLEYEDPETFGAGHIVLYSANGRGRFAITEEHAPDADATDPAREPIAWRWEVAYQLPNGAWYIDQTDQCSVDKIDALASDARQWARANGGTPSA